MAKEKQVDFLTHALALPREQVMNALTSEEGYVLYRTLRDMLAEYKYLTELMAKEGEMTVLRPEVKIKIFSALDYDRKLPQEILIVWTTDFESFLLNKRELLYQEIVAYSVEKGILERGKIKL